MLKIINSLTLIAACCTILLLSSYKPDPHPVQKATATVNQVSGIYVFISCQPNAPYTTLGTVKKTGITLTGGSKEIVKIMIKRAKSDYTECEGIIFDDLTLEHATVIKFK